MKKSNQFLAFIAAMLFSLSVMASTTTVSGPGYVCSYGGGTYTAHIDRSPVTKVVWTCGGAGQFSNGTQTITVTSLSGGTGGTDDYQYVNWGSATQVSWVQATYYYAVIGIVYTATGSESVTIGIPAPTAITSAPFAICNTSTSPKTYSATCPNGLVGNASAYDWSATGGGTASGSTNTGTIYPNANNTSIVLTVKFYSAACNVYSAGYSITIPRALGAQAPTNAWFDVVNDDGIHCFNHAFVGGDSYATSFIWTAPSSQTTYSNENTRNVAGTGGSYSISVKAVNDCGTSSVYSTTASTLTCNHRVITGISAPDGSDAIAVYPNPASAFFEVLIPENKGSARVLMTNLEGQVVRDLMVTDTKASIQSDDIAAGSYMINITVDGKTASRKMQIVK